ncbi:MAG: SWIM zinc finger family protein [SAR324 cluster bacterium]|nr:SWIM zinc finger family protein [SAR324 cluster bacterium]
MEIPLTEFEQYIDDKIVHRGLAYFKNNNISEVEEINDGEYQAVVEGSNDYHVDLKLVNGKLSQFFCDCPFDMGPMCKHVVALLFYIREEKQEQNKTKTNTNSPNKKQHLKRKTISEQIEELLVKITHDEIKNFIRMNAVEDKEFRNLFFPFFPQYQAEESKTNYVNQIKTILRKASGRYGLIDWSGTAEVADKIDKLLTIARLQMKHQNLKSTVFICMAVMEQMVEAQQYADDSNGEIGWCIDSAFDLLNEVAIDLQEESVRRLIIDYCFSAYDKKIYQGWDWHIGMLNTASLLIKTEKEKENILEKIDRFENDSYSLEYAQEIKYEVLLKTAGKKEAEEYLSQHLTNSILRRKAIIQALELKNYDEANKLALDGVEYDAEEKPGLVIEWYDWLLKIAQAQKDTHKIIENARHLLIDDFSKEQNYYNILKQLIDPDEWDSFFEQLIKDIAENNFRSSDQLIENLYIKEERWEKLLEILQQSPSLYKIENYESFLVDTYSVEIITLYAESVIPFLKINKDRKNYRYACRILKKMIKLGGKDKVEQIMEYLRNEYSNRRALMEELHQV